MSKLSEIIFRSATNHKVSSPFGKRAVISTSKGNTASFHNGTDYSTAGLKLPQYAIAEGTVLSCGCDTAYGGALYVWVSYPDLGVKMLHYHLDSYKVRAGQKVDKNTIIGYTGMTGKATGIHLHLGVKYLAGGDYIDPEKWSKDVLEPSLKALAKFPLGTYKVRAKKIYVRSGPGKSYSKIGFAKMTQNAQAAIKKNNNGKKANGYVKGVEFSVSATSYNEKDKYTWGRTPSGWVCMNKCDKT